MGLRRICVESVSTVWVLLARRHYLEMRRILAESPVSASAHAPGVEDGIEARLVDQEADPPSIRSLAERRDSRNRSKASSGYQTT